MYAFLLTRSATDEVMSQINRDKARLFPHYDAGRQEEIDVVNVLKAYSIYNPEVGYCQAQGPIAAFLLRHFQAEDAFWVFVSICDR